MPDDLGLSNPRYSLSSLATFGRASADMTSENSPILPDVAEHNNTTPTASKKARALFGRMLGRATSPSNESSAQRMSYGAIIPSITTSPTRDASPRPSLTIPSPVHHSPSALSPISLLRPPPTKNTLSSAERASRVRRNRKVLQILGDVPFDQNPRATGDIATDMASASASLTLSPPSAPSLKALRRHSSPISPVFAREAVTSPRVLRRAILSTVSTVPSATSAEYGGSYDMEPEWDVVPALPVSSSSTISLTEDVDVDVEMEEPSSPVDEERARKRATLAKLHRFLGSRVPPELVLGLPLVNNDESADSGPIWVTKSRRASHKVEEDYVPVAYMSDGELDRNPSRLSEAQKANIVRKKIKITKVGVLLLLFGVV